MIDLGRVGLTATEPAVISNTCTVFAEQEVISQLASGESVPNLIAGVHDAIAARICAMVGKLKIEPDVAVTGGGAKNIGLVKAIEGRLACPVVVPPEPLLTGALGAALIGKAICEDSERAGEPVQRSARQLGEATFFS